MNTYTKEKLSVSFLKTSVQCADQLEASTSSSPREIHGHLTFFRVRGGAFQPDTGPSGGIHVFHLNVKMFEGNEFTFAGTLLRRKGLQHSHGR